LAFQFFGLKHFGHGWPKICRLGLADATFPSSAGKAAIVNTPQWAVPGAITAWAVKQVTGSR
jgi:hypothetical protein